MKKKQPSLVANYIYNLVYEVFILIIPFVTATYTSRVFEPDGVGVYSFSTNIASYAVLIGSLGVSSYGQREIARKRDSLVDRSKIFFELFIFKMISTSFCLLVFLFPVFIQNRYSVYLRALIFYVISGVFDITWFFRGIEDFKIVSLWQIIIKLVSVVCLFAFIKEKNDLLLYILIISISTLAGNMMMWITIPKKVCKVSFKDLKIFCHAKNTFIYFVPTVATSVYTQLDKLMIGWITGDDFETGYYEQASKIIGMAKSVVLTINVVMSSRMSYLFELKDYDQVKKKIASTCEYILFLSIPITLGIVSVASDFVPVFFGAGYDKVVVLLYVLSPIIFIVGLSNVLGACYFTPSGQRGRSNKVIIGGACINIVLNSVLIVLFKSIGACIASVCAEFFITFLYLIMGKEWLSIKNIVKLGYKKIIAGTVMFLCILILNRNLEASIPTVLIEILCGVFIYFLMEIILRDKLIISFFKRIIRRQNE